jgi:hypothetical protein
MGFTGNRNEVLWEEINFTVTNNKLLTIKLI